MLGLDKGAMTELLDMEAVPISNTLSSLLGRKCKALVKDIIDTDASGLADYLPHFNVVMTGEIKGDDTRASQLYVFGKAEVIRLTNFIMGVPVDRDSPLDEIALSTLKEVASQSISTAIAEMGDFLGRDMEEQLVEVSAMDGTERIQELVHRWGDGEKIILVRFQVDIDGLFSTEVFRIASAKLPEVFGIPDIAEEIPDVEIQAQKVKSKTVAVQEVYFPEFKYSPVELTEEHIRDERKRLGNITLDVSARVGGTKCSIRDILALKMGDVLTLDKQAGSPADVVVNGKLIGRGDILVSDDRFSIRIIEILDKRN